jgi:hypothetical protein
MNLGAAGTTVGPGTYASFTSSTENEVVFTTPTELLEATKDDGTDGIAIGSVCLSTDDGVDDDTDDNDETGCQSLINVEVQRPGDVAYADLTLLNLGNIEADLFVQATQTCVSADILVDPLIGGGDACAGSNLIIQQYASATDRENDDTDGGACWYGAGALGEVCSFDDAYTLADFSDDYIGVTKLPMGSMEDNGARFLRISVEIPENSPNDLQGVKANFGFTWLLEQTA